MIGPRRARIRPFLRGCLIALVALFSAVSLWSLLEIWRNPAVAALSERSAHQIRAVVARQMTQRATPEHVASRLSALLEETPTPWVAIDAVQSEAQARGIALPSTLLARIEARRGSERGLLAQTGKCLSCGWDVANCELSAALLCRVPVDLTPVGDVSGVLRESSNYMRGRPVDQFDLGLSALGLGATAIAPLTGGSSLTLKAGASALKTTARLGRLSPPLAARLSRSAREAIDWEALSKAPVAEFPQHLARTVDPGALRPLTRTASAMSDLRQNTSTLEALHLIKLAQSPSEAARLARASRALGPRTTASLEILGPGRVLRLTMRYSDEMIRAAFAALGAIGAFLTLLASGFGRRAAKIGARALASPAPAP